ncbi:MAG: EAL domain-containing protein [Pseudomonadota bacterium]
MLRFTHRFHSLTGQTTALLLCAVAVSMMISAGLGYWKLYEVTASNSSIRIDRAARAAANIMEASLPQDFSVKLAADGKPVALQLTARNEEAAMTYSPMYDALLKKIGAGNHGAANLFKFNTETSALDRFATTFRKPDGSMPPPMSIKSGHPAYANLEAGKPHTGEVPVMGRMRLAYLTPILSKSGKLAGALAVDVGWADDLIVARDELRMLIFGSAMAILFAVAAIGMIMMRKSLRPLNELASFANLVAAGNQTNTVPHTNRKDEVGALAHGMVRVVELQDKLTQAAYVDELTGIGNRAKSLLDLGKTLELQPGSKNMAALLYIDLDGFKQINDAYGQLVGDSILKVISQRLCKLNGKNVKIARIGADEFTLIRTDVTSQRYLRKLAEKIAEQVKIPIQLEKTALELTCSIGIAILGRDASTPDEALRNAAHAMNFAKYESRGGHKFFASEMADEAQNRLRIERMLKSAIQNDEIFLEFQPQINPADNTMTGIEALARWHHETDGLIPPDMFIKIAEESGQIVELGSYLLDLACKQAAAWEESGFEFQHVSVNVSPRQIWQPGFVGLVKDILTKNSVSANNICIEVTESVFVGRDEDKVTAVLHELRNLGVSLSLDDFGSGYSSLGYLNRLPFDQLKIDRSFVTNIDTDKTKQNVMSGIISLARGLQLNIVVEGVETLEEMLFVKSIGCNAIQGYYYAKPSDAGKIPAILEQLLEVGSSGKLMSA